MDAYLATDDEVIAATLQWCNEVRETQGKEPLPELPKGTRCDPLSCPCGAATGLAVLRQFALSEQEYAARNSITSFKNAKLFDLPPRVQEFTIRFDKGEFPQFDADRI